MTTDIDREKLRELCERATPGPWRWWTSCSWRRLSSDAWGNDRNGKPLDRDGGVICPYVCRDGHPDLIITEEDADFITAARTSLPALLDLTDAQAAKIAELESEKLQANHELNKADLRIRALESECDQLRKQVKGRADWMRRAEKALKKIEIAASEVSRRGVTDGSQWSELTCALLRARAILSAAFSPNQPVQCTGDHSDRHWHDYASDQPSVDEWVEFRRVRNDGTENWCGCRRTFSPKFNVAGLEWRRVPVSALEQKEQG